MAKRAENTYFAQAWDPKNSEVGEVTHQQYLRTSNRLVRRFTVETGMEFSQEVMGSFTEWLRSLMTVVRSRTRSSYRSAIGYAFRLSGYHIDLSQTRLPETKTRLTPHQGEGRHATAQRSKSAVKNDIQQMLETVYEAKQGKGGYRRNEHIAALMLALSAQTGLRPIEWLDAKVDGEQALLIVKNAKYKDGRGRPYRTINIEGLEQDWVAAMQYLIERVERYSSERVSRQRQMEYTARLGESCRKLYDRVFPNHSVDKPRITLYTGRHLFAAQAKADPDISGVELSALMGHGSLATVFENYAPPKRKRGSGIKVRASEADIKAVQTAAALSTGVGMRL